MANQYMGVPGYSGYEAYNPGMPYYYTPSYRMPYNPYSVAQNTQMQNQQQNSLPTPQEQNNQNITCIKVPDIEYAKGVFVAPNQTVYMIAQNTAELYAKVTDNMGYGPLRCFKLIEFDPTTEKAQEMVNSTSANFVGREEFNQFASNIVSEINTMKNNLNSSVSISTQVSSPQDVKRVQQKKNLTQDSTTSESGVNK